MGIHSRDYIRETRSPGVFGGPGDLWAIKFLLIANAALFFVTAADPRLMLWLDLEAADLASFQVWRLVTYGFCHGNLGHIFWNMLILWMFGRHVEPIYGSREFLSFYLVAVVISGLCHVLLELFTVSSGVIGASGGVMAVTMLTAMHFPRMQILVMLVIPVELRWLAVLYVVGDLMGLTGAPDGVAHAAHLGGAVFGLAYKYYDLRVSTFFRGFALPNLRHVRRRVARPKVKLYKPAAEAENLSEQVDAILAKIHEQGEASLTDREREVLKRASQQYKHRT